ncbi:hypothetical protein N7G274_000079 [Stereocaulon virgatum]|uniref:Uncharacterized protein n=1 Tax=Stereocaulon virgatum TaxID=373712 RepID=A0ABR4ASS3_9LECA
MQKIRQFRQETVSWAVMERSSSDSGGVKESGEAEESRVQGQAMSVPGEKAGNAAAGKAREKHIREKDDTLHNRK